MKKKLAVHLEVNNWSKATPGERKKAAKWLKELADHLVRVGDSVHDRFTGDY